MHKDFMTLPRSNKKAPRNRGLRAEAINAISEYVFHEVERHTGVPAKAGLVYKVSGEILRLLELQLEHADLMEKRS